MSAARKNETYKKSSASPPGMVRALPTFEGYTVDERLREFRKASRETGLESVPFDNPKGQVLLRRYRAMVARNCDSP
jgi:hypothetical protein